MSDEIKRPNIFPEGNNGNEKKKQDLPEGSIEVPKDPDEKEKTLQEVIKEGHLKNLREFIENGGHQDKNTDEDKSDSIGVQEMNELNMKDLEALQRGERPKRTEEKYQDGLENKNKGVVTYPSDEEKNKVEQPKQKIKPKVTISKPQPKLEEVKKTRSVAKDYDSPYDLIPIPSEGRTYPHKKRNIKVAEMTTEDENILTSPHILKSGTFLDILFERKIIDETYDLDELIIGDRDAIMMWLRASAYGSDYTVHFIDPEAKNENPEDNIFEVTLDLSKVKFKHIPEDAVMNNEGHFIYTLPISKKEITFKILSYKQTEEINALISEERLAIESGESDKLYTEEITLKIATSIQSIEGITDRDYIKKQAKIMKMGDSRAFRKYYEYVEPALDTRITVETPGGGSLNTFLPFTEQFFWPNI